MYREGSVMKFFDFLANAFFVVAFGSIALTVIGTMVVFTVLQPMFLIFTGPLAIVAIYTGVEEYLIERG